MTSANQPGRVPEFDKYDRLDKAISTSPYTRAAVAEYVGVRPETMSRYLSGKSEAPLAVVRAIALMTGVSFQWLQTGETPSPDGDGVSNVVRPKGFEPLTSCSGTGVVVACDFGRPAVAAVSSSVGAA